MAFTEKELVSLRADILSFKKKLDLDKGKQKEEENQSIIQSEDSSSDNNDFQRAKLLSSDSNYKLENIEVYNEYSKQYQSQLVYSNTYLDDELNERIKNEIDAEFGSDDDDDNYNDDNYEDENPVNNVILRDFHIDELLRPITKPSDITNIKAINNVYKQNFFDKLSNQTIEVIEKEQEMVNLLNKTMDIFLRDDPERISADNLKLSDYNHHLDLDKEPSDSQNDFIPQEQRYNRFSNIKSDDPFFKLPTYDSNPEFDSIPQEEIDETRQLLQIALQRNEEYIRSLSEIRLGFLHAGNYKEDIYKWCKEINENEKNQQKE